MERNIILNQIRTPDGTIIRSMHRHDYVVHIDANGLEYAVDGGCDYLRRNVHDSAPYEELSIYSDSPFEIVRENFHRGGRGKNGTLPLTWVPMSKMSDQWLAACIVYNREHGMETSFASKLYLAEIEYRKKNKISISE